MRRGFQLGLVLLFALSIPRAGYAGEIIDRVVATVNGVPILQSEADQAVRCEALLEGRALEAVTPSQQQAVLQRLIEQELLRQQMAADFHLPDAKETKAYLEQVRSQLPQPQNEESWHALLQQYGLTENELAERIAIQLQITKFIESRVRPREIDHAAVQAYYDQKFLPRLSSGAASPPPLGQVTAQIQEILRQEQTNDMLASWLRSLRRQSHIEIKPPPARAAVTGQESGPSEGAGK
jgi:antitoxin component HigA of HigAB toxin-antitoxin module